MIAILLVVAPLLLAADPPAPMPIGKLIEQLRDQDFKIREQTRSGIQALRVKSSVATTQDDDPVVVGRRLSKWLADLNDDHVDTYTGAMNAIRNLGPRAAPAVPALIGMLEKGTNPNGRERAVQLLSEVWPTEMTIQRALVRSLQNEGSEMVRRAILSRLKHMEPKPKRIIPDLQQLLKHKSPVVRCSAAEILAEIQESNAAFAILLPALADKDAHVRETIAVLLYLKGYDDLATLRSAVENENSPHKGGALLLLGYLCRRNEEKHAALVDKLLPAILKLLRDKEGSVRESASHALYLLSDYPVLSAAVPGLIAALDDPEPDVRRWCPLTLGEMCLSPGPAVHALTIALCDSSTLVRMRAAAALGRFGPKAKLAVRPLVPLLGDRELTVRAAAAMGLAGIGPSARAAIPALREAAKSNDRKVMLYAQNALKQIDAVLDNQKDVEKFDAIVSFWKAQFPGNDFAGAYLHMADGPRGRPRLHIDVPTGLESLYEHPFAWDFLEKHAKAKDNLQRAIANDLLSLKMPLLGKHEGGSLAYNGKRNIPVTDFVVEDTWAAIKCR